jgi:hypothetical protein
VVSDADEIRGVAAGETLLVATVSRRLIKELARIGPGRRAPAGVFPKYAAYEREAARRPRSWSPSRAGDARLTDEGRRG